MARYHVTQLSEFPYHITARCPNRGPFPLPLSEIWPLFENHLSLAHYKYGLKIHAFVLMPNHFHLICSTKHFTIGKIMSEFLGELSKDMNRLSGKINQNWGGRHYKCILNQYHYYLNCYKYVYQNPLRARLCRYSEEWPYSTLNGLVGLSSLKIPIEPDTILYNPHFDERELQWLNQPSRNEDMLVFRKALKKREFRLTKVRKVHPHELEFRKL